MDDPKTPEEEEKAKAASVGSGETGETESVDQAATPQPAPQITKTPAADAKTNGQEGPGKAALS